VYPLASSDDSIEEHERTVITTNEITSFFVYDLLHSNISPSHFNCQKSRLLALLNFKLFVTIAEQGNRRSLLLKEKIIFSFFLI
jgi:hypothetical protein